MDFFLYSVLSHKKMDCNYWNYWNGHLNMEDAVYGVCMNE